MAIQATSEEVQKKKEAFGFRLSKKQLEAGKKFFESLSQKRIERTKERIVAPLKAKEKARKAKSKQSASTQKRTATEANAQKIETSARIAELGPQTLKAQAETELAESKADQGHLATEIAAQKTETATKIAETARVKLGQAEEEAAQVAKQGGFEPTVGQATDISQFPDFDQRVGPSGLQPIEFPDALVGPTLEQPSGVRPTFPSGLQPTEFAAALERREALHGVTSAFTKRTSPREQDFFNVLGKLEADRLLGQAGPQAASQRARFERSLTGGAPLTAAQLARIDREAVSQINLRAGGGFLGIGKQKQRDRALASLKIAAQGTRIIAFSDSERQKLARTLKNTINQMTPFEMLTENLGKIEVQDALVNLPAGIANTALTGQFEGEELIDSTFTSALYQGILAQEDDALGLVEVDDPFGAVKKTQIEESANREKQAAIDAIAAAMVEQFDLTAVTAKQKAIEISKAVQNVLIGGKGIEKKGVLNRLRTKGTSKNDLTILGGAIRWTDNAKEYIRKLKDALIKFAKFREIRAQQATRFFAPGTRTAEDFFRRASEFQQSLGKGRK